MSTGTVLTAALISEFEKNIGRQRNELDQIEKRMNDLLHGGFLWEDPIAVNFRQSYNRNFEPLRKELFPAMERYMVYLNELLAKTKEWEADKIDF
jgi:hypothetical protein